MCVISFVFLFASILIPHGFANTGDFSPSVTTRYGKIEGLLKESYEGRQYAAYEGIPYAKPPVGELRFEEPQPITSWPGTWRATRVNKCIQRKLIFEVEPTGEEDCLYLNIYVPKTKNNLKKLDVVVHIHAGGFVEGDSKEWNNENFLMDRDIIYANFNYRLDAFGFLSTGDDIVPGNMGLKDQALAMKWIKENIEHFGGNPESITLTGFSAGAASVHYHYFSPLSRNLFNRGMSVSGSALNAFALQENPLKRAEMLAKSLRCDTTNKRNMVNCMKSRPAHLITKMVQTEAHPAPPYPYVIFAPVIERGSKNPFISEHPYKILKEGRVHDVPWIVSVTADEGAVYSLPLSGRYSEIDRNWTQLVKYLHYYDETLPESKESEIAEKIRNFYFPRGQAIDESQLEQITEMWTDRLLRVDILLAAQMQSKANKSPVYFYEFRYPSPHSVKVMFGRSDYKGVPHGDDMQYFFGGARELSDKLSTEEIKMKNIALDIVYSYAHKGKPIVPNITWKPVGKEFYFLNISGPNEIKLNVRTDFTSKNFWESLGLLENANLFTDYSKSEL